MIPMQNRLIARHNIEVNPIRFKDTLYLYCRLLSDALADGICIFHQHVARHVITHSKENKKTYQHDRQYRCEKFRPNGFKLHMIALLSKTHISIPL